MKNTFFLLLLIPFVSISQNIRGNNNSFENGDISNLNGEDDLHKYCDDWQSIHYIGCGSVKEPTADWLDTDVLNSIHDNVNSDAFEGELFCGLRIGEGISQKLDNKIPVNSNVRIMLYAKNPTLTGDNKNLNCFLAKKEPFFDEACGSAPTRDSELRNGVNQDLIRLNSITIESNIDGWNLYYTEIENVSQDYFDWFGLYYEGQFKSSLSDSHYILIDNVNVIIDECNFDECCPVSKTYNGENYLPQTTTVSDFIHADNVTVHNNETVNFQASNQIKFGDGFKVQNGANFNADIAPCNSTHYGQINVSITEDCEYELCFDICNSEAPYYVQWSNGAQNTQKITVTPSNLTTYTATYNFIGQTEQFSESITIDPHYYTGDLSYDPAPNIFTPNGDGINDVWYFTDGNKTEFAYNAYFYNLKFFDRDGGLVYEVEEFDPYGGGFYSGQINFDGGELNANDYYFEINLKNCDYDETLTGWTYINKRVSKDTITILSEDTLVDVEYKDTIRVYPNPTSGTFTIDGIGSNATIEIVDVYGRKVKEQLFDSERNRTASIDISSENAGVYFINIITENSREVHRVTKN